MPYMEFLDVYIRLVSMRKCCAFCRLPYLANYPPTDSTSIPVIVCGVGSYAHTAASIAKIAKRNIQRLQRAMVVNGYRIKHIYMCVRH